MVPAFTSYRIELVHQHTHKRNNNYSKNHAYKKSTVEHTVQEIIELTKFINTTKKYINTIAHQWDHLS